jgi:hypothetical protein
MDLVYPVLNLDILQEAMKKKKNNGWKFMVKNV